MHSFLNHYKMFFQWIIFVFLFGIVLAAGSGRDRWSKKQVELLHSVFTGRLTSTTKNCIKSVRGSPAWSLTDMKTWIAFTSVSVIILLLIWRYQRRVLWTNLWSGTRNLIVQVIIGSWNRERLIPKEKMHLQPAQGNLLWRKSFSVLWIAVICYNRV